MLNKEKFSKRLKELRHSKGISTRNLANAIGLKSHGAITQFEKGTSMPALDTLVAIADFFEVTLDYLVGHSNCSQLIPDYINSIFQQVDNPEGWIAVLKKVSINENGQLFIKSHKRLDNENQIEEMIKGLDDESLVELEKFLRYLSFRQTLGEADKGSVSLDTEQVESDKNR
jgi:transcriptional regulator with XRE-family HTH domain